MGTWLGLLGLSACSQPSRPAPVRPPLSDEDRALAEKFAVLRGGGELIVDSVSEKNGVNIFDENGRRFYARAGMVPPGGISRSSYGANFGVPKTLHATWRTGDDIRMQADGLFGGGVIAGDYTVPVASRIPDDLLQDLRRDPRGTFRLKIRLHDDGVLIGWDIERRPGYDRNKRDKDGEAIYVAPVFSFAGGDFQEARIYKGIAVKKGWYIHPKTGQRIETDF